MKSTITLYLRLFSFVSLAVSALSAAAFSLDTYAPSSVLADGKWVKISVSESGIYKITRSQLQQWGFSDPAKVAVYGYGGNRIPDRMLLANYIDDLPQVQSLLLDDGGIVFFGVGPEAWTQTTTSSPWRKNNNVYTTAGYYFVSDKIVSDSIAIPSQGVGEVSDPVNWFVDRRHYELDQTSPGEAGYILTGENFRNKTENAFTFSTPDPYSGEITEAGKVLPWGQLECGFVSKTFSSVNAYFTINGEKLTTVSTDRLSPVSNSAYLHGAYNVTAHDITAPAKSLEIKISVPAASSTQGVWLDYLAVNFARSLVLPSDGYLNFWSKESALRLSTGSAADVIVWDVTDPRAVTRLNTAAEDNAVVWGNDYSGMRTYVAFTKNARIPSPNYVGTVRNQNIHGMEAPEMVIFTLPEFRAQAERLASLHSSSALHPLTVEVLNVEDVYNEFASGSADVSALRKCLKMFYDRSAEADKKLGYVALMGRATYDNRHLTSQFTGTNSHNTIPYWMGGTLATQLSDNTAFGTDDFIAMLADGSGSNMGYDDISVAVGRIPATSVNEAKNYIDKLYQYVRESSTGTWKNSFLFLADDGDGGVHLNDTEKMIAALQSTPDQQSFINKVYIDAYDIVAGVCSDGRDEMYRLLDEGVVWWNYSGHANNHSWTGEGMLTYTDINNLFLRKVPIVLAATCDFLRWDSNVVSGGEIMLHERNGGAIAMISATRPVYISDNGLFTRAVGRSIARRDSTGVLPRLGRIYQMAKNNILNDKDELKVSNPNRLRYVLMGDPALVLPTPSNFVRIETIAGEAVTPEAQVTLKAMQQAEISGGVYTPQGELIEDFDGTIQLNIYDAERSLVTKGQGEDNEKIAFEHHGGLLYSGSAKVAAGRFTVNVAMPGDVSDNFRPAMINAYAFNPDRSKEAIGINTDFYVYGFDDTVEADSIAPSIDSFVLNHSSFVDGDEVNDSPMVIATVSDNVGINLSTAGIGHQMTLTLDGKTIYTDVALFYTASPDGTPSGEIHYPLSDLAAGYHTLTLKVWDTASNSTTHSVDFVVDANSVPTIFDVYTDVNPASTEVKFFISHNRPDAHLTATITVYDLLGHPLWETTSEGLSDMFVSAPISWDLTDAAGRRLPRGIYLYRATISTDNGDTYDSAARRLAITAQ